MTTPTPGGTRPASTAGIRNLLLNPRLILLLAVLLSSLLYAVNVGDFFVHDSAPVLEENAGLRISGANFDDWRTASLSTHTGPLRRPISMLTFAIDTALAGKLDPVAIKMTNVLLHGLSGVFLWLFLSVVLQRSPLLSLSEERAQLIASLAAALWLLHPLQVSTVMYAVQRMTQLAALFTFAGLWHLFLLRARWLETPPSMTDFSRLALVGLVWTAVAALSKENGLLLPLLAAATELTLFRFRVAGGSSPVLRWGTLGALGGVVLVLVGLPLLAPETMQAWYANRSFTLGERLFTQSRLFWHYLGWTFLPDITAMGFNHDDIPNSRGLFSPITTALSIVALAGVGGLAWWQRNRWPLLGFALLWFLCGHVMESSIIALEMSYEHRNYLPMAGPLLLLAALPLLLDAEKAGLARVGLVLFLALLVPLLYLRGTAWTSERQLAETNYRNHPESARAGWYLASAYFQEAIAEEDRDIARQYFAASRLAALKLLDTHPGYVPALAWLIVIDSNSSDRTRIPEWQQRLGAALDKPSLHVNDVVFVMLVNDCVIRESCPEPPGGQEAFLRGLYERHPSRKHLLHELAKYLKESGCPECALVETKRLLEDSPDFWPALQTQFQLQMDAGRQGEALETARQLMLADEPRRMTARLLGDPGSNAP